MSNENVKVEVGKIVVFQATDMAPEKHRQWDNVALYINEDCPIKAFSDLVDQGLYSVREASLEEKEFCYFSYETTGKEGVLLAGLEPYKEWKAKYNK